MNKKSDKFKPYTIIYGLQSFDLQLYNSSHLKVSIHRDIDTSIKHDAWANEHRKCYQKININKGCFVVFDSSLIHGGGSFKCGSSPCYRIHFYVMDKRSVAPVDNLTVKKVTDCGMCSKCGMINDDEMLKFVLYDIEGKYK